MTDNKASGVSMFLRLIIVLIILGGAGAWAAYFIMNPASPEKRDEPPQSNAVLVELAPVRLENHPIKIEVMGQIIPARETALKARVSGEIVSVSNSFIPGGFFEKGTEILRIDDTDYQLDIKAKKAALAQAQAAYRLEEGQQKIARDELKMIEESTGTKLKNTDLALRKPQLEQARADINAARANLEISELNLERTTLNAPFNSIVTVRNTDLGNTISAQDTLATLVSTDTYWVRLEMPVRDLKWVDIPSSLKDTGSNVIIMMDGNRGTRAGYILKETGTIDETSRMVELIAAVPDPLLRDAPKVQGDSRMALVLGDFVKTTIIGKELSAVARIPKTYIRDGNTIWLLRGGKLAIQQVTIAHADRHHAYVTEGLSESDRIITSNIVSPVNGMALTTHDESKDASASQSSEQSAEQEE